MTFYKNREKFGGFSSATGRFFSRFGLSPNQWTLLSVLPAIAAAYFIWRGSFISAALLFIFSGFMDMIDGAVARHTEKSSRKGAYLDTVTDRYVEFIIIAALMLAGLPSLWLPSSFWILAYLFGALMTSYVKAAAKEKDFISGEAKGGLVERAERLVLVFVGLLLASVNPFYLTCAISLLAVLSNVTAFQRISIALSLSSKENHAR